MKLVVTGGGTGGHIYPALVVADLLVSRGAQLTYLGSQRGQEADACAKRAITFHGYPSAPLYSLRTPAGWKSLVMLLRARQQVIRQMRADRPDVVFSTGGYSAGPVVAAARSLGVPFVIHEANSVPGRANLMFAGRAAGFTSVFRCTEQYAPGVNVTRTGQPIRPELREAATAVSRSADTRTVLVLGGSQGSEFLNKVVPEAALLLPDVQFVHAAGRKLIGDMAENLRVKGFTGRYDARGYLETSEMVDAYSRASLVVARSGGTVAEIAMFGLPSVLVPLPTSADDHQLHNAEEFVEMGAATLLQQGKNARPEQLAQAIGDWLSSAERRSMAAAALSDWDVPDAADRIARIVEQAASHA